MKKLIWGILVLLLLVTGAGAENYSGKAGCVIPSQGLSPVGTVYGADGSTPVPSTGGGSTALIEYISLGTDGVIGGPDSSGDQTTDDLMVLSGNVGSSALVPFSGQDGKFWNGLSGVLGGGVTNNFIVRVWDRTKSDPAAQFGESAYFICNTSSIGFPAPNDVPLNDFSTIFPKSVPSAPSWVSAESISATPPGATIKWFTALGARSYYYEVTNSTDPGFSSPLAAGTVYADVSRHFASVNSSTIKSVPFDAGTSGDNKDYLFRVKAVNSFGSSGWVQDSFYIPATPNNNRPSVVSDLRVTGSDASSITIGWTAPYLLDAHGVGMAATSYDIRIATTPIVDTWEASHTNPDNLTTWASADPITGAPYSYSVLPTPLTYPAAQTITIANVPTGHTYYLALKSFNGAVKSYISNVTGAQVGSGGTSQLTYLLTIESRVGSGGHGINHFSLPFPGPWYAYQENGAALGQVRNAYDLIKAINAVNGNAVSTFTEWLGALATPSENGIIVPNEDPDGTPVVTSALQAISLQNGRGYELYATKSLRLVIKNY